MCRSVVPVPVFGVGYSRVAAARRVRNLLVLALHGFTAVSRRVLRTKTIHRAKRRKRQDIQGIAPQPLLRALGQTRSAHQCSGSAHHSAVRRCTPDWLTDHAMQYAPPQ
ncbi:PREDICTED: uncharacterized protein LOC105460686 isoform X1 [Wasmannia auropunctata]|uniref:uncharacterized protein LOC105460686 isoform X1 n=1 Tax=Wasmannia auropunctata TaxID=64793 RepID=UPI0005EE0B47|nr:PREDICTED: uncharacterized protein LOC105460686 isoform X1 [Wasmannia auropunctata]